MTAFEGTLDEISTTMQGPEADCCEAPVGRRRLDATKVAPAIGSIAQRFGGGSKFDLTFTRPIEVSTVREGMLDLLAGRGGCQPGFAV